MSKRLSGDHSGYTERELTFIRWFILMLYALVLLSVIIISALIAIATKNPLCGVYGILPTALLIPMHKIIDRVFPRLSPEEQAKRRTSSIRKIPPPSNTQPIP
jgi:hypothetical protein